MLAILFSVALPNIKPNRLGEKQIRSILPRLDCYSQVFQRRMDGSVDFFRNWANYKLGFGSARGEHWLGNDNIHVLTNIHENNQLRIDLEAHTNERAFAQYGNFSIASEADDYRMFVDNYLVSSTVTGMTLL